MALRLVSRLKSFYPSIGLVVLVPEAQREPRSVEPLRQQISDLKVQENVHLVTTANNSNTLLLAKSTVYLRPTTTDGDSLAVREALSFGVPVVASDSAFRPPGTILFRSRDDEHFERIVASVLRDLPEHQSKLQMLRIEDNYQPVLDVYQELLSVSPKY
jgi:hypothetical protein